MTDAGISAGREGGRWLGLDVGRARIGVALSDPLGWTARGIGVVERRDPDADLAAVQALVRTHAPCGVVIGLPRRTDGSLGPEAAAIERLARRWAGALGVPVYLWDERFTTVEAERTLAEGGWPALRRRRVVDQLAAAILLQAFLERRRRTGQPPLEIRPIRADDEG